MQRIQLSDIDDLIFREASKIIARGEHHEAVLLVFPEPAPGMPLAFGFEIGAHLANPAGEEHLSAVIEELTSSDELRVIAVVLISECWQIVLKTRAQYELIRASGVCPSDHPDRIETLMVLYYHQCRRAMASHPIHRELAKPYLERGKLVFEDLGNHVVGRGTLFSGRPTIH
jgi:hypothetical protein